jgi:phenylacetate-CoA ligase
VQAKLASQYWPVERLQSAQLEGLKRLVAHAGQQVPYYRDLFRSVGFDPRSIHSPADLQGLPILTREIVQAQGPRMLADDAASRGTYVAMTGGSTGRPMRFWHDTSFRDQQEAAGWMSDMATGWRPGARTAYLWGAHRSLRPFRGAQGVVRGWLRNQRWYDAFDMSEAKMLRYHQAMQSAPPELLVAYASSVTLLAKWLEANGLKPNYPGVALIPTAEALDDVMRASLERVFRAPVFNRYGSSEVGLVAYECDRHQALHLNLPDNYVECVGPDVYTEPGELLITQLNNYSMPLIRYQIDDLAVMERETCACGRGAPSIRQVVGRVGVTVSSASGALIHAYYFEILIRKVPGVREFQLVQENLRHLRVLVVAGPGFALEAFEPFRANVRRMMGDDCSMTVELVDRIPPGPSGKAPMVVSKVPIASRGDRHAQAAAHWPSDG